MGDSGQRAARLNKLFYDVLDGKYAGKPAPALFLEAVYAQPNVVLCADKLIGSEHALSALASVLHRDNSPIFLSGQATSFLRFIQSPDLRAVHSGDFLRRILTAVVDPPIFWNAIVTAFQNAQLLSTDAQSAFAWLLLELIQLPGDASSRYITVAKDPTIEVALARIDHHEVADFTKRIRQILDGHTTPSMLHGLSSSPGGRHDNDFEDFRDISILPTGLEIASTEAPFLRPRAMLADLVGDKPSDLTTHLDNQFRLLREDMLHELRESHLIAVERKKGRIRGLMLKDVKAVGVYFGPERRRTFWGMKFQCKDDLPQFKGVKNRKKYVEDETNRNKFARHGSLTCLLADNVAIAFPCIHRDDGLLALNPPNIVLQFTSNASLGDVLRRLKRAKEITIVQIDAAVFAYEPVLRALQSMRTMELAPEVFFWHNDQDIRAPPFVPQTVVDALRHNPTTNLRHMLALSKDVVLDSSQAMSLLSGLQQRLSLIQGPPGTGKSFIGALIAKALYSSTSSKLLVVCYTNHALDQFLEDLLDIGIPPEAMIRLGGKSTQRTSQLGLYSQTTSFRPTRAHYALKKEKETMVELLLQDVSRAHKEYSGVVKSVDVMAYLEFEADEYFSALTVPLTTDGMTMMDEKGKPLTSSYLFDRWLRGWNGGIFQHDPQIRQHSHIWAITKVERQKLYQQWVDNISKETTARMRNAVSRYNDEIDGLLSLGTERDVSKMVDKRIVACTTTAAAKYSTLIQKASSPDVVLVEEAGEILESHVITALGKNTQHLILIGDHKQLRPKVNDYQLTVEKNDGFDLNMSMFERLVHKGFPHEKLTMQHRMRPEISRLVRALMYPDLVDAPGAYNRPNVKGIRDNVVFINHTKPEDDDSAISEQREGAVSSKVNSFEIEMVLKIVRYLGQQGYGTDDLVILTPYLGNLRKMMVELRKTSDPILNDLDSSELVKAGLLSPAAAASPKKRIRLATIDNYQGEESKIVIISLTRSNERGNIGFMSSPERLNVLLSRARDGMILIGNSATFMKSPKGGDTWKKLFDLLKQHGHMYSGLPTQCERHTDKKFTLEGPLDFDQSCPDGGCDVVCNATLICGHNCPSKCHNIVDHSKMPCRRVMNSQCTNGHKQTWECHRGPPTCIKCEKNKKEYEEKIRNDFEMQERRDKAQRRHDADMAKIDAQIAEQQAIIREAQIEGDRRAALEQKRADLQNAIDTAKRVGNQAARNVATPSMPLPSSPVSSPSLDLSPPPVATPPSLLSRLSSIVSLPTLRSTPVASEHAPYPVTPIISESAVRWRRQKEVEGARNGALDDLMALTGLENVKKQALSIRDKIETLKRQGGTLKGERFNAVFQGNPGTGKTTVARIYAKFLTSVDALPGTDFVETTGARLASDGVDKTKAMVEAVLSNGGGAIFVDEAYQLVNKNSYGGGQVLDFLLAEMENNKDKLVFIFAGYVKQMEEFFEHNPGLQSRVPYVMRFDDFTDAELLDMLVNVVNKKYGGRMKFEDGTGGLYTRIAVRRLGRGRGRDGFGNARSLENLVQRVAERQATRIALERRNGNIPDDLMLTQEDLIGPEPSGAAAKSDAWKKLMRMVGLNSVKESVKAMLEMLAVNYQRELVEKGPSQVSLNRVFLGSPGTGKTTVARYYGQILADLGMLSNGEVVVKNPADFIGSALGQSEEKTKKILDSTLGKVLVIDEAYMLYSSNAGNSGNGADLYRTAVIDAMVAEIQSTPGEDRCVLLLGYKAQMEDMFQNVNPGLARRFAIENAFNFLDFSDDELREILDLKLKAQDMEATPEAMDVALELLGRERNRPNFGNGGAVDNLLGKAKTNWQKRQKPGVIVSDISFEPQDFDVEYNRRAQASSAIATLFNDVVGHDDMVKKLEGYAKSVNNAKNFGMDTREIIPTCFIFKGPPGTGKTTVARKFGEVYYNLGFLSTAEVTECSASDLVGQYVGQTGPKVMKLLEKALGRVLFIDEAYRLADTNGSFAKEAVDELVGLLTQDKFKGKIVVVLAGYEDEINRLLSVNPGLSSRFPDEFVFKNMDSAACLDILQRKLAAKRITLPALTSPSSVEYQQLVSHIEELSKLSSWGNARDMETLAKDVAREVIQMEGGFQPDGTILAAGSIALEALQRMLETREKRERGSNPDIRRAFDIRAQQMPAPSASPPPTIATTTSTTSTTTARRHENPPQANNVQSEIGQRDPGVPDATWNQLQHDRRKFEEIQRAMQAEIDAIKRHESEAAAAEAKQRAERERMEQELKQQIETTRRKEAERKWKAAQAREEQERIRRVLLARRLEQQQRAQERERQAQQKLRQMGVCVAGYQWIKQSGGYRCAGGSHWVSDSQLDI